MTIAGRFINQRCSFVLLMLFSTRGEELRVVCSPVPVLCHEFSYPIPLSAADWLAKTGGCAPDLRRQDNERTYNVAGTPAPDLGIAMRIDGDCLPQMTENG